MTKLYQAIVHKLWYKGILRLNKQEENGLFLRAQALHAIRKSSRLESHIRWESDCLGALALNGLYRNQIEFIPNDLHDGVGQLVEKEAETMPSNVAYLPILAFELSSIFCCRMKR